MSGHPRLLTKERKNSINQQILSLSIAFLSKNGTILSKLLSGKNSYSAKPSRATEQIAATPTPRENPSTPSSSAPNELRIFSKIYKN